MSSHKHPLIKDNLEFGNKDAPIDLLSSSMSSSTSSSSESSQHHVANRRVVKSCLWSTVIFSINFISSILVINLAKW
jgi:hypothetical protein